MAAFAAPRPVEGVGGQAEEDLAWEGVVPGMQGRLLVEELEYAGVVGQPVEQDLAGGDRVLGRRPLLGRHIQTVGHNPWRAWWGSDGMRPGTLGKTLCEVCGR